MGKGTAEQQLAERMRDKPGIGTRVRVTHKPEHDNVNLGRFMSFRSTSTGKIGFVEGHSPDGDLLVGIDGAGATWWHPDEVIAAPIFAETCESLRDELANERAAHAEAERLLSAERAALEVSRAKVLDLEMRAVEAERLLSEARRQIADAHAAFDKAGALTHMIGNESRGIDEQRATLAERAEDIQQARIEAERRENEARVDAEIARAESLKTRQDAQEARDRLSRVKAAVDALRAAWFPISGEDAARYRDHMGAIERALAGVVSAPTSTFTFGRFVSGHVQRLRDGTWEWCHDSGFDHGVIDLAPDVCAFLSSVAGPPRPVLTEDRAREMAEEAIEASMNRSTVVLRDNMTALLLRISRGDFGEAHREPAAEHQPGCAHGGCDLCNGEPRTDLAALADAIEANGRTWQRVEPSTVAQALRAVDRRMRTLEAAVTALAASVEQVQTKAGIGETEPPSKIAGPWRNPTGEGRRWRRTRVDDRDDLAGIVETTDWRAYHDVGRDNYIAVSKGEEHDVEAAKRACDAALRAAGWTLQDATAKPASPLQGDVVSDLVLGTIDGQPIRARYTGVTPTEPRKP